MAEINGTTFWLVAGLVMAFSWWDWVDPVHWGTAFVIRGVGSVIVLASGFAQRLSGRVDWAAAIAKVRFAAAVVAVAGALAVLDQGYVVGLAGIVVVLLAGPYIAVDRRDLLVMDAAPLAAIGARAEAHERSARSAAPPSVIVCDIDNFKEINDRHGHDAGDRVIRAVAERLSSVARATDALGRWGGEEFLAILPQTAGGRR